MNTAPLQNSAVLQANTTNTANRNDANASTVPFHQMLSNEVAGRNRNTASANNQTRSGDTQVTNKPADKTKAKEKTINKVTDKNAAATEIKATAADKPEKTADDKSTASSTASVTPISAELLALVAGVQGLQASATSTPDATDAANPIDAKLNVTDDAQDQLLSGKAKLPLIAGDTNGLATDAAIGKTAIGADRANAIDTRTGGDAHFDSALKQIQSAFGNGATPDTKLLSTITEGGVNNPISSVLATSTGALFVPALQSVAQTVVANPANKLMPQVGTQAWDAALGQKMVWMVAGAQQSATLTLNPPDLGPLQVVLHVNNSHANATFVSGQADVRQALEAALPKLREMLNDAGIQLGQANVGTNMPNQQSQQQAATGRTHGIESSGQTSVDPLTVIARSKNNGADALGIVDIFA